MHGTVLVGVVLLTVCCAGGISLMFLEQPNLGQLFSPIGKILVLNCTVGDEFLQSWSVASQNFSPLVVTSDQRRVARVLNSRGIYLLVDSEMSSQLFFNGTRPIEVMVFCIAAARMSDVEEQGNQVSITIYDSPPTPTNFKSIENGPGSINISWTLTFIPEVTVNFTLTAHNLNTSISLVTQEQHYIFSIQDLTSCDVYNFTVTAMADSGSSPPSEVITRSIPSIPDIALVTNSVTHSLVKTESNNFTLNIRIQDMSTCIDYPVLNYIVTLEDGGSNIMQRVVIANTTSILINDLVENTHYVYYIRAENQFGNSSNSAEVKLMTTDVQSVTICQVEDTRNYLIQCSYVEGSDARGCAYNISSGGENVTGTIPMSNTEGVIVELNNATSYDQVIAHDWERDGSNGVLPILGNLSSVMDCPAVTTISVSTTPHGNGTVCGVENCVPIVLGTLVIAVVIVILFAIVCCYIKKKTNSHTMGSKNGMQKQGNIEANTMKECTTYTLSATKIETSHVSAVVDTTSDEVDGGVESANMEVDEDPAYNEVLSLSTVKPPDLIASKVIVVSSHDKCEQNPPHDVLSTVMSASANLVYSMISEKPGPQLTAEPESETTALDEGPVYSTPERVASDGNKSAALKIEEYSDVAVTAPPRKKKGKDKSKNNKPPPFFIKAPPCKTAVESNTESTECPLYSTPGQATPDGRSDTALKVEEYSDVVVSAPARKKKGKDKLKGNKPPPFLVKAPPYKASPSHQTGTTRVVENDNSTYSVVSDLPKKGKNSKKASGVMKTPQYKANLNRQIVNSAMVEEDSTYSTVADQQKQVRVKATAEVPPYKAGITGASNVVEDDGTYSTVFNESKKVADRYPDEYATLNLDSANRDPEQQNEAQPDSDLEAPPPIPAYCPSGGDSPC